MLTLGASALEDKNNSDIMLISLPIKKRLIVLFKYVSTYAFAAYAILVCYLLYVIVQLLNLPITIYPVTTDELIVLLFAITIFGAISFPLNFKYGYTKAKMANLILFFIFVFGGSSIIETISENNLFNFENLLNQSSKTEIMLISLLSLMIVLLISYSLSLVFYKNREF